MQSTLSNSNHHEINVALHDLAFQRISLSDHSRVGFCFPESAIFSYTAVVHQNSLCIHHLLLCVYLIAEAQTESAPAVMAAMQTSVWV